ncbi:aspartic peptidase domain-containing protein [Talaromyces proteolyticus]|uniref:Aspartic peptidase domain-containing protein n=1 Tax=Talaromyces proteolyticus TaxID=1131652 RepID=A0AAD4L734_9EURO|nr:aspartic peptidase domain-containing protein [Talaromyces proteolyticus]KAH8705800.1 aspartic peptidase domain-containing protein [Talaromyces proteolyticus]
MFALISTRRLFICVQLTRLRFARFGDDGQWSTVYISIGNDSEPVAVLPNTVGVDILVVDDRGGCLHDSAADCSSERGGLFSSDNSSTWQSAGGYRNATFNGIGLTSLYANYGDDYVSFDLQDGYGPTVAGNLTSSVATFNSTDTWVGFLGLALSRSALSDLGSSTFMENVWDNRSSASSCSYGYTAGAYYRLKGVPASLVIGGYDQLRFVPNDVSFNLSLQYVPVVSLSSIQGTSVNRSSNSSMTELVEASINSYFTLDTSTSYIWLPQDTCDMFSEALNLTWDDRINLYTYGDDPSNHDYLASANISFTFAIADTSSSSEIVNITLPFSAFDQSISYPYPGFYLNDTSQTIPYFPIKPASNSDEYRIGRVFFQEAYIIVDYERGNFSVSQANWAGDLLNENELIVIDLVPDSEFPGETSESHLSKGAKAGIIVGSLAGFIFILIILWWFVLRKRYIFTGCLRRRDKAQKNPENKPPVPNSQSLAPRRLRNWLYRGRAEVAGDHTQPSELSGADMIHELPGSTPGDFRHSSPATSKQALRRSRMSIAPSSIVSFTSSTRMSVSSDGSIEEEELISPHPTSRPSSIAKHPFTMTDTTATENNGHETTTNRSSRIQPGEIVVGPSSPTNTAHRRSED